MTNRHKQIVAAALGLIILVAFGFDLPQQEVVASPVAVNAELSHFYEKVEHVQLKDGSFATITSRDTSTTTTVEE